MLIIPRSSHIHTWLAIVTTYVITYLDIFLLTCGHDVFLTILCSGKEPAWSWTNHTKMGGGERSFCTTRHKAIKLKGLTLYFKSFLFLFLFFGSLSTATFNLFSLNFPFTLVWHIPYTVYHNVIHINPNEITRNQYHILHGVVRVHCVDRRLQCWMAYRYIIILKPTSYIAWYWTILSGVPNMPQTTIAGCENVTDNDGSALPACLPMSDFTWVCSLYTTL